MISTSRVLSFDKCWVIVRYWIPAWWPAVSKNGILDLPHFLTSFHTASLAAFMVGQTESGYTAVQGDLGFPAIFTMMDQPFNLSTGIISFLYCP
jgi:hypothetical protein